MSCVNQQTEKCTNPRKQEKCKVFLKRSKVIAFTM